MIQRTVDSFAISLIQQRNEAANEAAHWQATANDQAAKIKALEDELEKLKPKPDNVTALQVPPQAVE